MAEVLTKGRLVRWTGGASDNVGTIVNVGADGRQARVAFDHGEELTFAYPFEALEPIVFQPGALVRLVADDQVGVVMDAMVVGGVRAYTVNLPGDVVKTVFEGGLRAGVVTDPVAILRSGQLHSARSTNLRLTAMRLQFAHQFEELSSLSDSRVEIKPHQVGVLHRVATSYPHRFLLADEVGLGKTIEAGLIIKELKARGMANRVLVLAPSGLCGQWQVEMKTKFGMAFSLYRSDSVRFLAANQPGDNPWTLNDNVIASTTYASWNEHRAMEVANAGWDLVVIDEAHHARRRFEGQSRYSETKLYRLASMLADPEVARATSMLLLTATPMQLHRFELYSLIELLDPALFPDFREFEEHADSLAGLNRAVDGVRQWPGLAPQAREIVAPVVADWVGSSVDDAVERLESVEGRARISDELERQHRLSEVLIRNRKVVVGGFMPRVAAVWPVELTPEERAAYDAATGYARDGFERAQRAKATALGFVMVMFQKLNSSSSYALRQSLVRRIGRLQTAAALALPGRERLQEIEEAVQDLGDTTVMDDLMAARTGDSIEAEIREMSQVVSLLDAIPVDSKAKVLVERLDEIRQRETDARVLVFTQFRDTQDYLVRHIGHPWTVGVFHGQLAPQEKDEVVRAFRDGAGPRVLLSTEAGGEGRNFQFCHYLVNYDLPWNPMRIEQRIGRLDRIGQKHPVTVVNFAILGTVEERVLEVLSKRIRVFEETIGGLDPILGDVESDLRHVFLSAEAERERSLKRLEAMLDVRIAKARAAERQMADLIMDTRSFRQDEVQALLSRTATLDHDAMRRFVLNALAELGAKADPDPDIQGVYDLRLAGRFENEFPQLVRDSRTRRVTFDPMVAMDHETIEFMAFGHDIVDALVARVTSRSYPGRASLRVVRSDEHPDRRGWFFSFVLELDGVARSKSIVPVFVDAQGVSDEGLASWLLERAARRTGEDLGEPRLPSAAVGLEEAVGIARGIAMRRLLERQAEMTVVNGERLAQERAKLVRYYDYRQQAATDKVTAVRATFERLAASEDPEVAKIVPVWAKNLERAERTLASLGEERATRLDALTSHEDVTAQFELLTASWVEIVPEGRRDD